MSLSTLGQDNFDTLVIFDEFRVDPNLPKALVEKATKAEKAAKSNAPQEPATFIPTEGTAPGVNGALGVNDALGGALGVDDALTQIDGGFAIVATNPRVRQGRLRRRFMNPWWVRLSDFIKSEPVTKVFKHIKANAAELAEWNLR
jgi:hypothetical protein